MWKPAEQTPAISLALFDLFKEAGLPPGVFNLIYGGVDVGEALVLHPGVEVISMTGSTMAAFQIARLNYNERVKRGLRPCALQCEAGGKNPAFVMLDADIRCAVGHVVSGAFLSAGQRCTATGLLLVERGCAQEVTEALVKAARALKVGLPTEDGVRVGPLVDGRQLQRVDGFVERARKLGLRIECGGRRMIEEPLTYGWFYEPTVVTGVSLDAEIAQDEVFGPVLPVVEVVDFEEAVAVANRLRYGLKSAIHTNDRDLAQRWIREVRCGGVHVNDATAGAIARTPFGGASNSLSAIGLQECGPGALRPYQRQVAVFDNVGGVALSAAR